MQSGDERLEQPHEKIEWEVLSAVRVSGQLQVVARGLGSERTARLMRQQHAHIARRGAGHGSRGIGGGRQIRDASHQQAARSPFYNAMLVREHRDTQALELAGPTSHVPVVLMVARHEVRPMRRPQPTERRYMLAQLGNETVSDVPGHGDEIGPQRVGSVDDGVDKPAPDRWSDVQVTELQNPKASEVAGKMSDGDGHTNDERPSREDHADEREERRCPDNHENHGGGGREPE